MSVLETEKRALEHERGTALKSRRTASAEAEEQGAGALLAQMGALQQRVWQSSQGARDSLP